jgi:hypothetical protein
MSDNRPAKGMIAEFETPRQLLGACERMRHAGFTLWDAHTPYPVHGMDRAMGLRRSRLPLVVFAMAMTGGTLGMLLQGWVHAIEYPLVISGKPFFSWQAFIPVTFELTILFGALGALLGMLGFNRLPALHNWLFEARRFERASDDRFFVSVQADDPKFDEAATASLLLDSGAVHVEMVRQ